MAGDMTTIPAGDGPVRTPQKRDMMLALLLRNRSGWLATGVIATRIGTTPLNVADVGRGLMDDGLVERRREPGGNNTMEWRALQK